MIKRARLCLVIFCFTTGISYSKDFPVKISDSNKDVQSIFIPSEEWFLPTGSQIKATIQNAIFSFNLQTPVIAVVDEPVICPKNGNVVLPAKTRFIGTSEILKSDDRVNVKFVICVLPNGQEFEVGAIALSPDGSAGIKGTVKEYKDIRLMSSAASGALLGVGQAVTATMGGQPIVSGAIGGALTQGAQEAQQITNQKVDVSISVPPFQKTVVFLSRRLVMDEKSKETPKPREHDMEMRNEKKNWKDDVR